MALLPDPGPDPEPRPGVPAAQTPHICRHQQDQQGYAGERDARQERLVAAVGLADVHLGGLVVLVLRTRRLRTGRGLLRALGDDLREPLKAQQRARVIGEFVQLGGPGVVGRYAHAVGRGVRHRTVVDQHVQSVPAQPVVHRAEELLALPDALEGEDQDVGRHAGPLRERAKSGAMDRGTARGSWSLT
ncbi:hypothetical protein GCM10010244_42400 [Streptomyces coeruleorubidus]|nr:hypothetical protein GCM10010244_42400 [Streptomyces bellus]